MQLSLEWSKQDKVQTESFGFFKIIFFMTFLIENCNVMFVPWPTDNSELTNIISCNVMTFNL